MLNEATLAFDKLQIFESALASLTKPARSFFIPCQGAFSNAVNILYESLNKTCYFIHQFSYLLNSWPATGSDNMKELNFSAANFTPTIFLSSKGDGEYELVRREFDKLLDDCTNLKRNVEKNLIFEVTYCSKTFNGVPKIYENNFKFYTPNHVTIFNEAVEKYKELTQSFHRFVTHFESHNIYSTLTSSLRNFEGIPDSCRIYIVVDNISKKQRAKFDTVLINLVEDLIECVTSRIRLLFQAVEKSLLEQGLFSFNFIISTFAF